MYGYRVRLPAVIVQPRWATKVTVDDYSWHNDDAQAYLEIAILNAPSYTVQVADRPAVELHGAHIHCVVGDENFHCTAPPGVAVEIATVAVDLPGIDWSVVEFSEADYADTEVLLLPAVLPFSDSGEMREYEQCNISIFRHTCMRDTHPRCTGPRSSSICCTDWILWCGRQRSG